MPDFPDATLKSLLAAIHNAKMLPDSKEVTTHLLFTSIRLHGKLVDWVHGQWMRDRSES